MIARSMQKRHFSNFASLCGARVRATAGAECGGRFGGTRHLQLPRHRRGEQILEYAGRRTGGTGSAENDEVSGRAFPDAQGRAEGRDGRIDGRVHRVPGTESERIAGEMGWGGDSTAARRDSDAGVSAGLTT